MFTRLAKEGEEIEREVIETMPEWSPVREPVQEPQKV